MLCEYCCKFSFYIEKVLFLFFLLKITEGFYILFLSYILFHRFRNIGLQHYPQLDTAQMMETYDVAASSICHGLKGLSQGQGKLCQLSVDHMPSVAKGAKFGILECQHQFHDRRWNCSTVSNESVFGPMLRIGIIYIFYREDY